MSDSVRTLRAWFDSPTSGVVELERDWNATSPLKIVLSAKAPAIRAVAPAPAAAAGRAYGYYVRRPGEALFILPLGAVSDVDPEIDEVFVAGDFNGWQDAVGRAEWRLKPAELDGEQVLLWTGPTDRIRWPSQQRFKFVTGEHLWLCVPDEAANAVRDDKGNVNRLIDPVSSGRHLWRFALAGPVDLAESHTASVDGGPPVGIQPGAFFFELSSDLPMGAIASEDETTFRLFAPRARMVKVSVCDAPDRQEAALSFPLTRRPGAAGVWEVILDQNLHGWLYWYSVEGAGGEGSGFDPAAKILDPYALAACDRGGPGVILDRAWIGAADRHFRTPPWQDLVISEAHVRDLSAHAPVAADPVERRGFSGLRRWVESPEFYLHDLGVNCVELQPVQEFDNATPEEYHWGYMTNNFFAPESSYSLDPAGASGVKELQELVAAFHSRGIAVLLDVVYNHSGLPAHLMAIDRLYYFVQDPQGKPTNWSGCGNDIRAGSAMMRRLIVESCRHLIDAYGVDGFRFDLAELLGVGVLREIERELKAVKPDVILIAEPWSFRGHIAGSLRDTGWASWNDGYRDFVADYVRGRGAGERLEYFLRGSPWYFAKWPAQTVNYTESHDDRAWIDKITENPNFDGFAPTANDRRRTHLMAALLFMSLGIPMIAEGQDFLRSKHGLNNSYQRGDLNALDYRRLYRYLGTHAYFADWIEFRLGPYGRLLRHFSRPGENFLRFFRASDPAPLAALYNASGDEGPVRLLFAINPTANDAVIAVGPGLADSRTWRQVADEERFYTPGGHGAHRPLESDLSMPPLSCTLWLSAS